jgi:hypothetical protein
MDLEGHEGGGLMGLNKEREEVDWWFRLDKGLLAGWKEEKDTARNIHFYDEYISLLKEPNSS